VPPSAPGFFIELSVFARFRIVPMAGEYSIARCHECKRQLTAIDYYGERLTGCMTCNIWWPPSGPIKRLPEEDLHALYRMMRGIGE
jgi:hypothetical protein